MNIDFWSLTVGQWLKTIDYPDDVTNNMSSFTMFGLRNKSLRHIQTICSKDLAHLIFDNIQTVCKQEKMQKIKSKSTKAVIKPKIVLPDIILQDIQQETNHINHINICSRQDQDIINMINLFVGRIISDAECNKWWEELNYCFRNNFSVPRIITMLYRMDQFFNNKTIAACSTTIIPKKTISKKKIISEWNITVTKTRNNKTCCPSILSDVPTIQSKHKKKKSCVGQLMTLNYDTVLLDKQEDKVFSFHKTSGSPCLLMTVESALMFLNSSKLFINTVDYYTLDNTKYSIAHIKGSKIIIYRKNGYTINDNDSAFRDEINCTLANIMVKCCNCSVDIKVINIIRQITNKIDPTSEWTYKNFVKRICKIERNALSQHLYYCKDNTCKGSHKGGLYSYYVKEDEERINCKWCPLKHDVKFHQFKCSYCKLTYCEICDESPYHTGQICLGPSSAYKDIDEETLKVLKQTSKPCPKCSIWSTKHNGCDHITCSSCKTHWCYRCMQELDPKNPYVHTCPTNLDGKIDSNYRRL